MRIIWDKRSHNARTATAGIAVAILASTIVFTSGARAQETAAWPGYTIDYSNWGTCHHPWTNPSAFSCVAPAHGYRVGYVPFLAQIFVDRPAEDFLPEVRAGKALWEMQHVCGGVLVAPHWVLTAGHCITPEQIELGYKVRLGVDRIEDRKAGIVYKIRRVVPYPGFKDFKHDDLALVEIEDRPDYVIDNPDVVENKEDPNFFRAGADHVFLKFINIAHPAGPPPSRFPWMFEVVNVYGWGKTRNIPGDAPAPETYAVDLHTLPNDFCARLKGYDPDRITDKVFCAVDPRQKTCRGDSGGPALDAAGNLVGIVSWGNTQCTDDGEPGVYTRVAAYAGWIDGVISDDLRERAAAQRIGANVIQGPSAETTIALGAVRLLPPNKAPSLAGLDGDDIRQPRDYPGYCVSDWTGKKSCWERSNKPWPGDRRISPIAHILAAKLGGNTKGATHLCSAIIVAPDWVLTAAHCVRTRGKALLRVGVGYTDLKTGRLVNAGEAAAVEEIIFHPEYRGSVDLALVRFRESASLHISNPTYSPVRENDMTAQLVDDGDGNARVPPPGARPIRFADISTRGDPGVYASSSVLWRWSKIDSGPAILSQSPLFSLPRATCNQQLQRGEKPITETLYCALTRDRPVCPEDAGAPVMGGLQNKGASSGIIGDTDMQRELLVAGINVWNKKRCAAPGEPATILQIDEYKDWIRDTLAASFDKRKLESARIIDPTKWEREGGNAGN